MTKRTQQWARSTPAMEMRVRLYLLHKMGIIFKEELQETSEWETDKLTHDLLLLKDLGKYRTSSGHPPIYILYVTKGLEEKNNERRTYLPSSASGKRPCGILMLILCSTQRHRTTVAIFLSRPLLSQRRAAGFTWGYPRRHREGISGRMQVLRFNHHRTTSSRTGSWL